MLNLILKIIFDLWITVGIFMFGIDVILGVFNVGGNFIVAIIGLCLIVFGIWGGKITIEGEEESENEDE